MKNTNSTTEKAEAQTAELLRALNEIANLWPRNTTVKICDVNGPNDGQSRAILLEAAIDIARNAIAEATCPNRTLKALKAVIREFVPSRDKMLPTQIDAFEEARSAIATAEGRA